MKEQKVFDFASFPVLQTERLTLRKPLMADAADVLLFRGDYEVQRFNAPVIATIAQAEEQIIQAHAEYGRHEGITWAITLTGQETVLGHIALHHWSHHHRRAEAGYDLARAYWGQGYATESLRAIVRFGFTEMNLHRIYANTIADNHPSVRLLERLAFTREGTRRESSWEDDGRFHDSALYGLLRSEWQQLVEV